MIFALALLGIGVYVALKTTRPWFPLPEGTKQFLAGLGMMAAFLFIWTH